MKKLLAIAAFLLASTAAQAQYTFEYGGRTIRVDPDRGTVQIPGVYDNTKKAKRSKNEDSDRPAKQPSQQAKTDPQTPPAAPAAPPAADPAPAATPPAAALPPVPPPSAEPATSTAAVAPADTPAAPPPPPAAPVQQDAAPAAPAPAPASAFAAVPPVPKPAAPAPAQLGNSPLGVWLTEEKEGKVRIEQCGGNLCGYAVDKKSNQNGEQILINMKHGKDAKWRARILDPNSGSTYDSTIALNGSDTLRVQGCAFGGMFCGGQTWSRVN